MEFNKRLTILGFFLTYFTLSIFEYYYLNSIPVFYFNVLNVDRTLLGFMQLIAYTFTFFTPLTGFFYEKHVRKMIHRKIILITSNCGLGMGFLIFILFKEILFLFVLFLVMYLYSVSMIRTIMINFFLNISKQSESIKDRLIFIVKTSRICGFLVISLFFRLNFFNLYSIQFWNFFFVGGLIISIFLIVIVIIVSKKLLFILFEYEHNVSEKVNMKKKQNQRKEKKLMVSMYISYFLGSSDAIFIFLFSSWIWDKFGESHYIFYSSIYFIFILGEFLGNFIAQFLCKRYEKRKIMFSGLILYNFLMISLIFSYFPIVLILKFLLFFTASIANFTYTSFTASLTINEKWKTFKYQLLNTFGSLASIVFIPIGTMLSTFIDFEVLVTISSIFFFMACTTILTTFLLKDDNRGEKIVLEPAIKSLSKLDTKLRK
ncbi:MAG: MFS transporter [Promethearchaeota archaeon]